MEQQELSFVPGGIESSAASGKQLRRQVPTNPDSILASNPATVLLGS